MTWEWGNFGCFVKETKQHFLCIYSFAITLEHILVLNVKTDICALVENDVAQPKRPKTLSSLTLGHVDNV